MSSQSGTLLARRQLDRLIEGRRAVGGSPDGCPYYRLVPKQLHANLLFRKRLLERAHTDPAFAAQLREMCRADVLFYINAFCWIFEPRGKNEQPRRLPFITWEFQDETIITLRDVMGEEDLVIKKSRDMGATWMIITVMEWFWHFQPNIRLGLISRNEQYVDGDDKSLFAKIDFLHAMQPAWLLPTGRIRGKRDPNRSLSNHTLTNADNASVVAGEATTGNMFRGDRLFAAGLDEHASWDLKKGFEAEEATRDATNCRIYNSTPRGSETAHAAKLRTDCRRVILHWTRHPIKVRGLYERNAAGRPVLKDVAYWRRLLERRRPGLPIPENPSDLARLVEEEGLYRFVCDNARLPRRSPWFDRECRRAVSEREILQEVDMQDDVGEEPFYNTEHLRQHAAIYAAEPMVAGNILHGPYGEDPELEIAMGGELRMWRPLDAHNRPPQSGLGYAIGIDVASGTENVYGEHASESVMAVIDLELSEMVGLWAQTGVTPERLAVTAFALGHWFTGRNGQPALLNWEGLGPGLIFGKILVSELGYPNVCWKTNIGETNPRFKPIPGYHADARGKLAMHSYLRRALEPDSPQGLVIHCQATLDELGQFCHTEDDSVEHRVRKGLRGETISKSGHGDKGSAAALAWIAARPLSAKHKYNPPKPMPRDCAQRFIDEIMARTRGRGARALYRL